MNHMRLLYRHQGIPVGTQTPVQTGTTSDVGIRELGGSVEMEGRRGRGRGPEKGWWHLVDSWLGCFELTHSRMRQ